MGDIILLLVFVSRLCSGMAETNFQGLKVNNQILDEIVLHKELFFTCEHE